MSKIKSNTHPYNPSAPQLGEILLHRRYLNEQSLDLALKQQVYKKESLGEILLKQHLIDPWSLENALVEQIRIKLAHAPKIRLGQVLQATGKISVNKLKEALRLQKTKQHSLGKVLLLRNWIKSHDLHQSLRLQKRYLRQMLIVSLGVTAVSSCKAPVVPFQNPQQSDMRIAATHPYATQALRGDFKTLQLNSSSSMRVYRNGSKIIENVPFFKQGQDNTCGQAVIAMLANFWGQSLDYQQLVNQENRFNLATSAPALRQSLRNKGLNAQDLRKGKLDNLIAEINQGRPTAVLLDFGSIPTAHYVVVVGYNLERQSMILHDSIEAPYIEMPMTTFVQMWENKSIRSILPIGGDNYQRLMFQVFKK